ncbi:MAG: hypothetical protein IPH77_10720 [Ignavibacteria bacterium]|nr:hypothetical protein [Ignavibacteria bacterium]
MNIHINKVSSSKELNQFINFPKYLYTSDKNFIFEPFSMQKEFLSDKNYFLNIPEQNIFLLFQTIKLSAGLLRSVIMFTTGSIKKEHRLFGLFESVDNYEVAELLFDKVKEILSSAALTKFQVLQSDDK